MDIETQIETTKEQLPQIRRITKLEDIQRVIPPKPILPKEVKPKPLKEPRYLLRVIIIGVLFLGILGVELAIIYKYDKLNKRLYQISVSLKDNLTNLKQNLQHTNIIIDKLISSRQGLVRNYIGLDTKYKILQFKMDNYEGFSRDISLAKSSKINLLKGDLRVVYARVEAMKAQNELLEKELNDKGEYIQELTAKIINNMGEQEILLNENLRLKGECERLSNELKAYNKVSPSEGKDVNK